MNWEKLKTYGSSSEKSFEMLCNQLFDNWCKAEYNELILSFNVVNGAGGDGGVESYAELKNGEIIGLQAKWFLTSIDSSHISQIRNSVKNAMKIRPSISKYIVCVPRNLASLTGKGENTEKKRWNDFVCEMRALFSDLSIELWDDARITSEMQKPSSSGIHRFWFKNSEIEYSSIVQAINTAKSSWLSTKYVPDLNATGKIRSQLLNRIGSFESRYLLATRFQKIVEQCKQFAIFCDDLIPLCEEKAKELFSILSEAKKPIKALMLESAKIHSWLINECFPFCYDNKKFNIRFDLIENEINNCSYSCSYRFHLYDVIKALNNLKSIDFYDLLSELEECVDRKSVLFLGDPGTGKTQGVSAFADEVLLQQFHFPIIIQARSIPESYSWREIILHTLGLADVWNEDELWQGLICAVNRNRFNEGFLRKPVLLYPKVLVIVDGIDESLPHQKWIDRINETTIITEKFPQVRFCFTSRPVVFPLEVSSSITSASIKRLNSGGDVPVYKLFDNYIKYYDIKIHNCQWLKYALNTPLALKLFCELHKGQKISISQLHEISMEQLWRNKISMIQREYDSKIGISNRNQRIFNSIVSISKAFVDTNRLDRKKLVDIIIEHVNHSEEAAESLLDLLEAYGVLGSCCEKGTGLLPDRYIYSPGIQGYFDYAEAVFLLEMNDHPSKIDFEKYNVLNNTLYSLAVISIQKYNYLLTSNPTINKTLDSDNYKELRLYALQHSSPETALNYKDDLIETMKIGANSLATVVNKLVLPLARLKNHPLGVSMLDKFLSGFDKPAARDIIWSLPAYLNNSEGQRWYKTVSLDILDKENEEYDLTHDDLHNGLPIVYAWALSNVNNSARNLCKDKLMKWAQKVPNEFYKLFLRFSEVNDPQIRSDLFSILMCLVYDGADDELIKEISDWVISNILSEPNVYQNRDVSIRYYSIGILEKAKMIGLYSEDDINDYFPPYKEDSIDIELNKDALSGTRMEGYSAITYDLARYVLVDHFDYKFNSYKQKQLDKLVKIVSETDSDYSGIKSEQFIISVAYAYICRMGWNEKDFYNTNNLKDGHCYGADRSIEASFHSADHGAQSRVMTVCEKYIWAARNYISGYLSDRLLFGDDQSQITDYNLLDDFFLPIQGIKQIDHNTISNNIMCVPEPNAVLIDKPLDSKKSIIEYIKEAPNINWEKWIRIDNERNCCAINSSDLLVLEMNTSFYEQAGVNTNIYIDSVLIRKNELGTFVSELREKNLLERAHCLTDWDGGVETSCYMSPKEMCWFTWKNHFDGPAISEFEGLTIHSSTDYCTYPAEDGETNYSMPSALLRDILGIVDTDGYHYYNKYKNVVAEYRVLGEEFRNEQKMVLVEPKKVIEKLYEKDLSLVWIMQELRRETINAQEKFGKFYAEDRRCFIGYYKGNDFVFEKLKN